ncbi:putative glutathione S-transferase parA [Cinnamomum micranthum f. kanehirae]|uniref:Putative glutathione S-transferase parA n=1 Tax=Cinnamomum micranthum f. kanehirae TaxID=337451 RepID=A0A443N947_9MAGN|nr:putative glutathione S-transferase parA [Cinnamomum micranthum f. kanehirae]
MEKKSVSKVIPDPYKCGSRILKSNVEAQEVGRKEPIDCLKLLEEELEDKSFYGGKSLGHVDVVLVPFACWFYTYETDGNFSIENECSKLIALVKRCMEKKSVSKVIPDPHKILKSNVEAQEVGRKEPIDCLKLLEEELEDKSFYGGKSLGHVDVVLVPFACWFYTYETDGNFSIENECSKLIALVKRCMEKKSVSKVIPDPHKVYDLVGDLKKYGVEFW